MPIDMRFSRMRVPIMVLSVISKILTIHWVSAAECRVFYKPEQEAVYIFTKLSFQRKQLLRNFLTPYHNSLAHLCRWGGAEEALPKRIFSTGGYQCPIRT